MSDSSTTNSQIDKNINGDRNQTIGQVLGGMVVYGTVIYNNPPTEPDSSTAQTKDRSKPLQLLAFQETDVDISGLYENIDYCELLFPETEAEDNS
jgi:hypothetical protein